MENLIGGVPGKGLKQANQVFGYTRLMVAAMALGAGEAALEDRHSLCQGTDSVRDRPCRKSRVTPTS